VLTPTTGVMLYTHTRYHGTNKPGKIVVELMGKLNKFVGKTRRRGSDGFGEVKRLFANRWTYLCSAGSVRWNFYSVIFVE
jgi:hypothetical protein